MARIWPRMLLGGMLLATSGAGRAQDVLGQGRPGAGAAPAAASPASLAAPGSTPWLRLPPAVRADLARLLRRQMVVGLAAHNHSDALKAWEAAGRPVDWPRWFFDVALNPAGRRGLLVMHAKLRDEGLWHVIGALGYLNREGDTGFMFTAGVADLAATLATFDYGNYWMADHGCTWGVRSPKTGAQLHFRRSDPGRFVLFSVHIDLHNPGDGATDGWVPAVDCAVAIQHWWEDDRNRDTTHTPDTVRAAVVAQGIAVPEVDAPVTGGVRLTEFLKWETDESGWFGHLWLKPRALQAGWWTQGEGARDFTAVTPLASRGDGPRFRLEYSNGHVDATVRADGDLRASWFQRSSGETRDFEGELEAGGVMPP